MSMVSFQIAECFTRIGGEHQSADSDGTKHIFSSLRAATCAIQVSFSLQVSLYSRSAAEGLGWNFWCFSER